MGGERVSRVVEAPLDDSHVAAVNVNHRFRHELRARGNEDVCIEASARGVGRCCLAVRSGRGESDVGCARDCRGRDSERELAVCFATGRIAPLVFDQDASDAESRSEVGALDERRRSLVHRDEFLLRKGEDRLVPRDPVVPTGCKVLGGHFQRIEIIARTKRPVTVRTATRLCRRFDGRSTGRTREPLERGSRLHSGPL
jgi:hypothetical protein